MVVIPVDAHLLTLTISTSKIVDRMVRQGPTSHVQHQKVESKQEIATNRNMASLATSLKEVNKVYAAADIEFRLRHTTKHSVEAPKGSETLDDEGFYMLAAAFPMNHGVSLLLVHRFAGAEGGASAEELGVCAIPDDAPNTALAHEFGHLLGLAHQGDIRDLMNPGLSPPGTPLTPREIDAARASKLALRFGGPAADKDDGG